MSETIWICEEHKAESVHQNGADAPPYCWVSYYLHQAVTSGEVCRMAERRLVSPTAVVIERDENGEWPQGVIERLVGPSPNRRYRLRAVLDALASSQGVEP